VRATVRGSESSMELSFLGAKVPGSKSSRVKSRCTDLRMLQQVKCGYMLRILNADVWVKSGCADVTL